MIRGVAPDSSDVFAERRRTPQCRAPSSPRRLPQWGRVRAGVVSLPKRYGQTSVPLSLLTRALLSRLFEMQTVAVKADNVLRYEALPATASAFRWDATRNQRNKSQSLLFSDGELGCILALRPAAE